MNKIVFSMFSITVGEEPNSVFIKKRGEFLRKSKEKLQAPGFESW
jgi:hypothetical protein